MKHLSFVFCISISLSLYSQADFDYKQFTEKMCSPEFQGRGYVNSGDSIAAVFIAQQLNRLGLDSLSTGYFQPFDFKVNTFPDTCSVFLGGNKLIPGKDFIVAPISGGSCDPSHCAPISVRFPRLLYIVYTQKGIVHVVYHSYIPFQGHQAGLC